jgi:hypothetical protein
LILGFLLPFSSMAQFDPTPKAVRVGFDFFKIAGTLIDPERKGFEFNSDLSLDRMIFSADLGTSNVDRVGSNFSYSSSGQYFRLGLDYNLLHRNPFGNAAFIGFRYGNAGFDEKINHAYRVPIWDVLQDSVSTQGINAAWTEIAMGMKVRVWRELFLGYTIRYRLGAVLKEDDPRFISYEIPGYGRSESDGFALSYHIFYRFPFKKPTPPRLEDLLKR